MIDFDDAGFGWHLFELATSLYFITRRRRRIRRRARPSSAATAANVSCPDEVLERLPLFLAARGTTYLGWVHTRQGSDTARELTPFLVERACAAAEEFRGSGIDRVWIRSGEMTCLNTVLTIGGKPAATTKTFNVLNPADETIVAACPEGTTALVDEAVASARRALPVVGGDCRTRSESPS